MENICCKEGMHFTNCTVNVQALNVTCCCKCNQDETGGGTEGGDEGDGRISYGDIVTIDGKRYKNITPNMVSNTEPAPYVASCSSTKFYPGGMGLAFQAFTAPATLSTPWMWAPEGAGNHWVQFDFSKETAIDAICFRDHAAVYSRFYGSNDGINFELLFTSPNKVDPIQYKAFERSFRYRYYRFDNNNGGGNGLSFLRFLVKEEASI